MRTIGTIMAALLLSIAVAIGFSIHLRLGQESLTAWGNYLTGAGTIGLALAAFFAGLDAVKKYGERTKAEQVRWVGDLFERFYQDTLYRSIRQKIDYDDLDDIVALLKREPSPEFSQEERDMLDGFTDYLNFFEWIAFLSVKKQMDSEDVKQIFEYYLKRFNEIKQREEVLQFLGKYGFENLRKLLLQYKSSEEKQEK